MTTSQISIPSHRTRAAALAPLLLATSLAATGCGSSSPSAGPRASPDATAARSVSASAATSSPAARSSAASAAARNEQARDRPGSLLGCLRKRGIQLPHGAARATDAHLGARALALPAGVTVEKLRAAAKNCGAPDIASGLGRAGAPRGKLRRNPAFKHALTTFVECMREHGVNMAPPHAGGGPLFNITGLNTKSPQFNAALSACRSDLARAFRLGGLASPGAGSSPANK